MRELRASQLAKARREVRDVLEAYMRMERQVAQLKAELELATSRSHPMQEVPWLSGAATPCPDEPPYLTGLDPMHLPQVRCVSWISRGVVRLRAHGVHQEKVMFSKSLQGCLGPCKTKSLQASAAHNGGQPHVL